MRRRRNSHWIVVLGALLLTASPDSIRESARGMILSVLARAGRLLAPAAEAAAEDGGRGDLEGQAKIHELEAEVARLSHALEQAGAVPEVLRGEGAVALIPVDARPMTGSGSLNRRMQLSEGSALGIARGQAAVVGTALAGRIVHVNERSAELCLVTDPAFRIRGVTRRSGLEGLVSGTAGDKLFFELEPDDGTEERAAVEIGELVMTSSQSSICPLPSIVGRVERVENFGAITRLIVNPVVDERTVRSVVVLRQRNASAVPLLPRAAPASAPGNPALPAAARKRPS